MKPSTIAEWEEHGFSKYEASERWFDSMIREQLAALNVAIDKGADIIRDHTLPANVRDTVELLRDAAVLTRHQLRRDLSSYCRPWFEVQQ